MRKIIFVLLSLCLIHFLMIVYIAPVKSEVGSNPSITISCKILDFDRWPVGSHPNMCFVVTDANDIGLKGEINPSVNWIKLSKSSLEGTQNLIEVSLDLSSLSPKLYKETIHIKTNFGDYSLPVRLDIVKQRAVVQVIFDNPNVLVDGKNVLLPAASFVYHGYTFVPLRPICEAFGASVSYKDEGPGKNKIITVTYQERKVEFFLYQDFMIVNGNKITIPELITNRFGVTFIPVVYLKNMALPRLPESLTRTLFNCDIQYVEDTRTTTLIY